MVPLAFPSSSVQIESIETMTHSVHTNQAAIRSKATTYPDSPTGRRSDKGKEINNAHFTTVVFPSRSPYKATPPDPTSSATPIIKATNPNPEVETPCLSSRKVANVTSIIIWPVPNATIAVSTKFLERKGRLDRHGVW